MENITGINGSENFPTNSNDVYGLIETIASQNIRSLKSTNKIIDGFYEYDVENGKVIEEAVIEMAKAQAFDKNSFDLSPNDPVVRARYFNNWESEQFSTTVRRDDIRAIIANKGTGVEDVVTSIMDTLSQGEGYNDFTKSRNVYYQAAFTNYAPIIGGVPSNMKGVVWALRDMYNHLISDNADLTAYPYMSHCPEADVRIAITTKLMNLIDVKEFATIFNLSKEELFGKLVIIDVDDLSNHSFDYFAFAYDRKALGRATRLYDYTQDVIGKGRYTNHYLTVERAYFHNGLFKSAYLDCTLACTTEKATIITSIPTYSITNTLTGVTGSNDATSIYASEPYTNTYTVEDDYTLSGAGVVITVTMGGSEIPNAITVSEDGQSASLNLAHVTGAVVVTITAIAG